MMVDTSGTGEKLRGAQVNSPATRERISAHWCSIAEASRVLGISEVAVRKRLASKHLTGIRTGRSWRVLLPGDRSAEPERNHMSGSAATEPFAGFPHDSSPEAILAMVRELQQQNLALAAHIGYLQHQLTQSRQEQRSVESQFSQALEAPSNAPTTDVRDASLEELAQLRQLVATLEANSAQRSESPPASGRRRWWPFGR